MSTPDDTSAPLVMQVSAERIRQIQDLGFDGSHDEHHGIEGLHLLAERYLAKGADDGVIRAAALVQAASDLRAKQKAALGADDRNCD